MSTQQVLVERFLHSWSVGLDEFCATVEKVFTDATIWENVGYSTTTGALDADGQVLFSIRCASVFDLSEDRITALREYFDTAPLVAARAAG
ncbi:hypothetical protein [Streptomyces sp. CA-106131]|uniref:hypothetical protein n=1 Tax=Streptomyces sp. CA-106131 TaxID=3240045 RepID=UPI003D9283CD